MNRGVLKPDDDFEEFGNIVIEHFATEERIYGRSLDRYRTRNFTVVVAHESLAKGAVRKRQNIL